MKKYQFVNHLISRLVSLKNLTNLLPYNLLKIIKYLISSFRSTTKLKARTKASNIRHSPLWLTALSSGILAIILLPSVALASPPSPLDPASGAAEEISQLFQVTFWIAATIFVIVEVLLIYAVFRYRRKDPDFIPRQIHGSTALEIAWTTIPALILAAVFSLMVGTIRDTTIPEVTTMQINIVGHQWWWEFEYPEQGFITGNELHIPVGEPIKVEISSVDVIHSFWVPRLGGKMDAIPGQTNITWLQANEPGEYQGICAELCGAQHAKMTFLVVAQPREEFDQWIAAQQASPAELQTELAAKGQQVFQQNACVGCHTIEGIAAGKIGPNLTHFASRKRIAGLVELDNTPENVRRWITDPQALKPLNQMPNLYLSQADIEALVEYLTSLK